MSILEPWFSGTPRVVRKMTQDPMPHFIDRSCLIQCKAESLSSLHPFSWRCQADDIDDAVTFGLLSSSDVSRVQSALCYIVLTAVTTDDSRSTSCSDRTTLVCHKTHTFHVYLRMERNRTSLIHVACFGAAPPRLCSSNSRGGASLMQATWIKQDLGRNLWMRSCHW